jgi:hypothetical protein
MEMTESGYTHNDNGVPSSAAISGATRLVYDATNHYSKHPNIYQRVVRKRTVSALTG